MSTAKPINLAVIGTGWITESFVKCAEATRAWRLAAVYSRSEETARKFGSKFSVSQTFVNLNELAASSDVDAVYIASPNSLHYEQAQLMLKGRKHVILEKPAVSTSTELDQLFKLAANLDVFLIEAFRHIHEVNFKILQQSLPRIGDIYGGSIAYASYSSRYNNVLAGETPNVFSLDYSGGSLVDIGIYAITAAVALFGQPQSQTYKPIIIHSGGDAGGVIVLTYEKFAISIQASKCYTSTAPSEIYGRNGTIVLNAITDVDRVTFIDAKTKTSEELAKPKVELNLQEEAEEFARIINGQDWAAAKKLEQISRTVQSITQDLRRQNSLLFAAEK